MQRFNLVIVAQSGRLQYEVVLFVASVIENSPNFKSKIFVAEPSGPLWSNDPSISSQACRQALEHLGVGLFNSKIRILARLTPTATKLNA